MMCPQCRFENRPGRRFCAECGGSLVVICPACGFANEAAEKFCGGCGQPLPARWRAGLTYVSPDTYTPKHLAEKILTSRDALEGERKQVTVLIADIKGSLEMLANRDPEEARRLLDPVVQRMMDAVHQFEGTVNQVMGDGIMALFGAPLAHEDHAVRACYAALSMRDAVRRFGEEMRGRFDNVEMRVGLNSGDVVVRAIGSDLQMDYSAVGPTTHLAGRLEQLAAPGTVLLTAETLRLAEGFVRVTSRGETVVKGLAGPVEVFELLGASSTRGRLHAAASHGLTPLVGRREELAALPRAAERARAGHGQVVALVGEPGVGKSRLLWEFAHSRAAEAWRVLEGGSVSYGKATTYLSVIQLLKAYFGIDDRDDTLDVRARVTGTVRALDPALEEVIVSLLALLDVAVDDPEWLAQSPAQRRAQTLAAVKRLSLRESQRQPLCLIFEDLQWIDPQTQAFLDSLVESVPTARLLLLLSYRPEYQHVWAHKTYYTQLRVDTLAPETAEELLANLVGVDPGLGAMKRLLIDRTDGNPFFLEESVRTLAETQVLVGERGDYRLAKRLTAMSVPATVQTMLAARIDRRPPEEKRLLQCASVIGKDVPFVLLQALTDLSDPELRAALTNLQAAELVYELTMFPALQFTFKHALTHDVAYASLVKARRLTLHARMVQIIEALYPGRVGEHIERLAHHAFHGELWEAAASFSRQAGEKALARSAHHEAVASFEQALSALEQLPPRRDVVEQTVDLRLGLRNALFPLGDLERLVDQVRRAETEAESIGDRRRLGLVTASMSQYFTWMGEHQRGVAAGHRALAIARELQDFGLEVVSNFRVGQACFTLGDYAAGAEVLRRNVVALSGDLLTQRFGLTGLPSVLSRVWLIWCFSELGAFTEAGAEADEAARIAAAVDHPFDLMVASFGGGIMHMRRGDIPRAVTALEESLRLCRVGNISFQLPFVACSLGFVYALAGRHAEALPLIDAAEAEHAGMRLMGGHALLVSWQSEAYALAGRLDEAARHAARALDLAQKYGEAGHRAYALRALATAEALRDPRGAGAGQYFAQALAASDGLAMRPLSACCRLGLGEAQRRRGERGPAAEHLEAARAAFEALRMPFWLERAARELAALG